MFSLLAQRVIVRLPVWTTALLISACTSTPSDPLLPALPQVGQYLLDIPNSASDTLAFPRRLMITSTGTNTISYQILRMDGTLVAQGRAPVDDKGRYQLETYAEDLVDDINHFIDHVIHASLQRTLTGYDCWLTVVTTEFCSITPCQGRSASPPCTLKYEGL
jgi:hypothetical protein